MKKRVSLLQAAIIIALTIACYIPAMRSGFIWDDPAFITENPLIQGHNGLSRIWWGTENPDYVPLTSTSFWVEWRMWKNNPAGYHVTNVLLHALSSVLIWQVLKRLRIRGAWLAALIFAIHPVCVESVAWVSERKNTLSMVFYVLSLMVYLKFEDHPRGIWYSLSVGVFLLALLSKVSVMMLPVVILLCALWQRGEITRKDLLRTIPFFILSFIFSLVTSLYYGIRGSHRFESIRIKIIPLGELLNRLAMAGKVVWFYIYKVLFPVNLMMPYPQWNANASHLVSFLPDLALIVSFIVFWHYRKTWGRPLLFGMGYFLVTLFPVLGFFKIHYRVFSPVADHLQYIAMIGIIALVTGGAVYLYDKSHMRMRQSIGITGTEAAHESLRTALAYGASVKIYQRLLFIASVLVVGTLGVMSWQQQHIYKDAETLWNDNLSRNPNSWVAYYNLGLIYFKKGLYDQAVSDYNKAIEINPADSEAYNNRGIVYFKKGLFDLAISDYNKALEINPVNAKAYNNRGIVYFKKGLYDLAVSDYTKALETSPADAEAYNNRGTVYRDKGWYDLAIFDYSKAIEIDPGLAEAYYNLGLIYFKKGLYDQAISDYNKALEINPADSETYNNRGIVYFKKGLFDLAISDYTKALEINPVNAKAYNNRGNVYYKKGLYDLAISDYDKAIEIDPGFAKAYNNRGAAYKDKGLYDRAMFDYDKAIEIDPRFAEAYFNKAIACEKAGHIQKAIEAYMGFIQYAPPQYASYIERVRQRVKELEK